MKCTHCGGNIVGDSCLQCARTASPNPVYSVVKKQNRGAEGIKEYKQAARGGYRPCKNCQRTQYCTGDFCSSCRKSVWGIKRGTPEYNNRLKIAREHFNPGLFKNRAA